MRTKSILEWTVLIKRDSMRVVCVCMCTYTLCLEGTKVLSEDVHWASELKKSSVTMFFHINVIHLLCPQSYYDLIQQKGRHIKSRQQFL